MNYIKALVSIVTVVYNGEDVLENTIKSIASQSFDCYEYIVIDGGSCDETIDIIRRYNDIIDIWISEPDNGIYDAMNKAILLAKGKWIMFLNAGDCFVDANVLMNVFDKKSYPGYSVIYGNTRVRNKDVTVSKIINLNKYYFYFDTICHQSIFFRTKLFSEIGLYNITYKILADREWLLRYSKKYNLFKYVDIDICNWDPVGYTTKNIELYKKEEANMRCNYSTFDFLIITFLQIIKKLKIVSITYYL
jgi:glycosyltransferase involved in cell wall biosynthesis